MLEILGSIIKNIAVRILRFVFAAILLPFLALGSVLFVALMVVVLPLAALLGPDDWFDYKKIVKEVPPEMIID